MTIKRIVLGITVMASLAGSVVVAEAAGSTNQIGGSGPGNFQGFRGGRNGGGNTMGVFANAIGITPQQLIADERAGKTILQVAQSKSLTEAKLISKAEAEYKKELDAQVRSKKLTAAAEQQMVKNFAARIKQTITRKGFSGFPHRNGGQGSGSSQG